MSPILKTWRPPTVVVLFTAAQAQAGPAFNNDGAGFSSGIPGG